MDADIVTCPLKSVIKCCDCGCSCSLTAKSSSNGRWIRSVKRKYDEFERSNRFYIPGLDVLPVARVGIENECQLLREMVSNQQGTIQELCLELEEERNASSSAANEAMSMILRLQREKADVQMEARQFKRFAEEKMSHDALEISLLEEAVYKKEQAIQSLTCEIQAYKHRMMSFGLTESEAEGIKDAAAYSWNVSFSSDMAGLVDSSPPNVYPQLICSLNTSQVHSEFEDDVMDVEKYPFGETPKAQDLRNLEFRINQLERTPRGDQMNGEFGSRNVFEKVIVGHSPRHPRHLRFSIDCSSSIVGTDCGMDSPRWGAGSKKLDCVVEELRKSDTASDYEDDMSDRVYTIDSVHPGVPCNNFSEPKIAAKICDEYVTSPMGSQCQTDLSDPEVKKLYVRIQALEADRESMRQTILSMQTDKAQVMLLREIAQQLCKDMTPGNQMSLQKSSNASGFSISGVFKWIGSFIFLKKKARRSKYLFELANNNPGLLLILDKSPHAKLWRCVLSTQVPRKLIA